VSHVAAQYATSEALRARRELHQRYSQRSVDLEATCGEVLGLQGHESLVDVGCGYGLLAKHLRARGHRGRLVGLDRSPAMVAEAGGGIVGDAQALPFPDGAFDVAAARHMLYHVPDIPAAVTELRRVAGTALVVTNGDEYMPRVNELLADADRRFGVTHPRDGLRFAGGNARSFLEPVFQRVELTVVEDALVIDRPEPIVRYLWSCLFDLVDWTEVGPWVGRETTRRLAALGGVWRDPKTVHFFRCF
jgi:SAM-dependent methyltransferase